MLVHAEVGHSAQLREGSPRCIIRTTSPSHCSALSACIQDIIFSTAESVCAATQD